MLANEILSRKLRDEAVKSKMDRLLSTYRVILDGLSLQEVKSQNTKLTDDEHTVKPGYNDIGLCETWSISSDMLWYQAIPRCYP
jgi:hypothetical protein